MQYKAHPTAVVEEGALIGDSTRVWHHCHIRSGAKIGSETNIGKNVYVDSQVTIGNKVKIQNNVSVYQGVNVEDGVYIGPHVTFTNDKFPRAVNPDMSLKGPTEWNMMSTTIRKGASIGAGSTIIAGIELGEWCMIGAGSVVTKNIPAFALAVGSPARIIGFVNEAGEVVKRSGGKDLGEKA